MTLLKTGEAIDPAKTYVVAGWACVNEGTEGPQIWDVVESHIRKHGHRHGRPEQQRPGDRRLSLGWQKRLNSIW